MRGPEWSEGAAAVIPNERFQGAWLLTAFETRHPDGTTTYPLGHDPVGIICWDGSGWFSAQLGPREPGRPGYIAYYGTLEAPDQSSGTLIHRLHGSSDPGRVAGDQVREFEFLDADTLMLSPPPAASGARSFVTWRRQQR